VKHGFDIHLATPPVRINSKEFCFQNNWRFQVNDRLKQFREVVMKVLCLSINKTAHYRMTMHPGKCNIIYLLIASHIVVVVPF
jgi:hypothetical protein